MEIKLPIQLRVFPIITIIMLVSIYISANIDNYVPLGLCLIMWVCNIIWWMVSDMKKNNISVPSIINYLDRRAEEEKKETKWWYRFVGPTIYRSVIPLIVVSAIVLLLIILATFFLI